MRTWTFPERRPEPDGPWDEEPDKAQWIDPETDLDCLVVRNRLGALCGYVGVPPEHPLHGRDYDEVDVVVHGGLTFASTCQEGAEDGPGVCHVPEPGRPSKVWWFGFDCAHSGDLWPLDLQFSLSLGYRCRGTYRTFDYVRNEVTLLAAQLADCVTPRCSMVPGIS